MVYYRYNNSMHHKEWFESNEIHTKDSFKKELSSLHKNILKEENKEQQTTPTIVTEPLNETSEMKSFLPKIKKIKLALEYYWIKNICYTAKDWNFVRQSQWITAISHCVYFEPTYEKVFECLQTILEEAKIYPDDITLPQRIIIWAQITEQEKYDEWNTTVDTEKKELLWKKINWRMAFFSEKHSSSLFILTWNNTFYTQETIRWNFHHELYHYFDFNDWWQKDNDPFFKTASTTDTINQWPFISQYWYNNINEAQAEIVRVAFTDMKQVIECIEMQLSISEKSTICNHLEFITWRRVNKKLIASWKWTTCPSKVFLKQKYTELQHVGTQKYNYSGRLHSFRKISKKMDRTYRSTILKQSIKKDWEVFDDMDRSKNIARIAFEQKIRNAVMQLRTIAINSAEIKEQSTPRKIVRSISESDKKNIKKIFNDLLTYSYTMRWKVRWEVLIDDLLGEADWMKIPFLLTCMSDAVSTYNVPLQELLPEEADASIISYNRKVYKILQGHK